MRPWFATFEDSPVKAICVRDTTWHAHLCHNPIRTTPASPRCLYHDLILYCYLALPPKEMNAVFLQQANAAHDCVCPSPERALNRSRPNSAQQIMIALSVSFRNRQGLGRVTSRQLLVQHPLLLSIYGCRSKLGVGLFRCAPGMLWRINVGAAHKQIERIAHDIHYVII